MNIENGADDLIAVTGDNARSRISPQEPVNVLPGVIDAADPESLDLHPQLLYLIIVLDHHGTNCYIIHIYTRISSFLTVQKSCSLIISQFPV